MKQKNNIALFGLLLIPITFIFWKLAFAWATLSPETSIFHYTYYITLLYVIPYYLIYKQNKIGYGLLWCIYLINVFIYSISLGFRVDIFVRAIDLWGNLFITIFAIIKYKRSN